MTNMRLFTMIIDYNGGTYITQATSENYKVAPVECIRKWDISGIEEIINENEKINVMEQLKDEKFVPLKGLKNIWCGTAFLRDKLMLINLVETSNAT